MKESIRNNQGGSHPQSGSELFALLSKTEIDFIQSELKAIKALLLDARMDDLKKAWIPKAEARSMLHVCQKTFNKYLTNGVIPHSRFAGKIYIKAADIQAHLEKHYINS